MEAIKTAAVLTRSLMEKDSHVFRRYDPTPFPMHEVSIMQDMLQLAEESLKNSGGTVIHCIKLRVGVLSGVVPEALDFAFDVLKKGTPAANSTLEFIPAPALFACRSCGKESWLESLQFECPGCHGPLTVREGGGDLELTQMEIS